MSTKVVETISEMKKFSATISRQGKSIGFVPTMGFLHKGHLSLVEKSLSHSDITIVSIFVNPTQFSPEEDFDTYPRSFEQDYNILNNLKTHVIFLPKKEEIYPSNFKTYVNVEDYEKLFCGRSRPNHFKGVTTIVNKLINIVKPSNLYLGEKDYQQLFIIRKMINDLNLDVNVIGCPLVRDFDGLALSSRNTYLNKTERIKALSLYKSLLLAKEMVNKGFLITDEIKKKMFNLIEANNGSIEYIKFINENSLNEVSKITDNCRIILAVKFGSTRLIDTLKIK